MIPKNVKNHSNCASGITSDPLGRSSSGWPESTLWWACMWACAWASSITVSQFGTGCDWNIPLSL